MMMHDRLSAAQTGALLQISEELTVASEELHRLNDVARAEARALRDHARTVYARMARLFDRPAGDRHV